LVYFSCHFMDLRGNASRRGLDTNWSSISSSLPGLLFAQPHNNSGANAQIVLAVVETVGDFGHEVLGLYGANGDVRRNWEINATASRHGMSAPKGALNL
jgi:hypothetical protein